MKWLLKNKILFNLFLENLLKKKQNLKIWKYFLNKKNIKSSNNLKFLLYEGKKLIGFLKIRKVKNC